jgi:hypothetical protein
MMYILFLVCGKYMSIKVRSVLVFPCWDVDREIAA